MDNEIIEIIIEVLHTFTENVCKNHWIPAIHDDKQEDLAKKIVERLNEHIKDSFKGQACTCGCMLFTHRHSNLIECVDCNKIKVI